MDAKSRRAIQSQYNDANNITPQSILKPIDMSLVRVAEADYVTVPVDTEPEIESLSAEQLDQYVTELEEKMREAARKFEFEKAAQLRDRIKALKNREIVGAIAPGAA